MPDDLSSHTPTPAPVSASEPADAIRPDWWSKSLGGVILGFTLAVALSGVFAWAGPGGAQALNKYQFNMWMLAPIWLGIVSFCFLFRSGRDCWTWLGGANLAAFAALYVCRALFR
ncbi:hypothetical protein ACIU1J_29210 [Azospirillum doebereinerae]|uniref:hypothetical protein n=1 Tax=Azospirillum doebereinerae TaxID=92933 RepID=UPI001EE55104|nr:hypothetical protein [Azospirillum doebereinerae]MCG5240292.1 hypothetical protein [Azospirillum doebereinerae]